MRRVVAADVNPIERRAPIATIHIAARHRVAIFPTVGEDRLDVGDAFIAVPIGEWLETFIDIPAVILATSYNSDFLDPVLPDVADPQIVRDRIEAKPPWFAEAVRPNLRARIGATAKWIVSRNRIRQPGVCVVHVDPQDLREVRGQILPVALRVLLRAGIAHRDVEVTIRTELNAAATMVLSGAHDLPQPARRLAGVGVKILSRLSLDHDGRDLGIFENLMLEEVFAVLAKARVKRQTEQSVRTPLIEQFAGHVSEQRFRVIRRVLFQQPYFSGLMHDKKGIAQTRHLPEPNQP